MLRNDLALRRGVQFEASRQELNTGGRHAPERFAGAHQHWRMRSFVAPTLTGHGSNTLPAVLDLTRFKTSLAVFLSLSCF